MYVFVLFTNTCSGSNHVIQVHALLTTARLLGFTGGQAALLSCLIAPVLYAGPLYTLYLSQALPFQKYWNLQYKMTTLFWTWQGLRNHIVVYTFSQHQKYR